MLKINGSLKGFEMERQAAEAVRHLLEDIPWISRLDVMPEIASADRGIDIVARFDIAGQSRTLFCEVKADGQPRHVRNGINQLHAFAAAPVNGDALMLIAPYLSEEARRICVDAQVGYLDFEGNCRLVLEGVYIDRAVPTRPAAAKRDLRSLFKPKSAQVLRVLLRTPERAWKVVELADEAGVSVGHVSNVRNALADREWATLGPDGLRLTAAADLLDEWRDQYEPPPGHRQTYYTPLHGAALDTALREVMAKREGRMMLGVFSAAKWIAPFARQATAHVYVDAEGKAALLEALDLSPTASGGNLVVAELEDDGLFRDHWVIADDLVTTSPAQTYLDLYPLGERGREAAEFLRQAVLPWSK